MQDHKIKIRFVKSEDSGSILNWRNDKLTREMSLDDRVTTFEEHSNWFNESLENKARTLYIGELNCEKIGICRFDFNEIDSCAEVSINMNPEMRSLGLGKRFLFQCIQDYLDSNEHNLCAKIKSKNKASLKIFDDVGFKKYSNIDDIIYLKRPLKKITFKTVDESDSEVLYKLLIDRKFSISHQDLPSLSDHNKFVKSKPYLHWIIIFESNIPVGSYYIQNNNSIGINLISQNKRVILETLKNIKSNFSPHEEKKSKIPPYFYINVPYGNEKLKNILIDLQNIPIQTSFKLI